MAADSEPRRWSAHVERVEDLVPVGVRAIHVMDREADSFALLAKIWSSAFVIRAMHDRVVELPAEHRVGGGNKLKSVLALSPTILERSVRLSRRLPSKKGRRSRIHPPREERVTRLGISASSVLLPRPKALGGDFPETLAIHVVSVVELDAPPNEKPVEWVLLTNLPIDTAENVAVIVDYYRSRWLIEELFKALKTGCRFEERHFESLHSLLNVLATMVPIAWQLLLLRHLARHSPELPATSVLTPTQLEALREFTVVQLPPQPTVRQAMLAIAQLGGHLRNNGEPGWQVLGRGFHDLLLFAAGRSSRNGPTM